MPIGIERRYQEIKTSLSCKAREAGSLTSGFINRFPGGIPGMLIILTAPLSVPVYVAIDNAYFAPARKVEAAVKTEQRTREQQAREAQILAKQEETKADFELTDGVNMDRFAAQSYLFTLRGSANVASSREEVIGRVIARISRETGCPSVIVSYLPADSNEGPVKHEAYSATAICNPKAPQ